MRDSNSSRESDSSRETDEFITLVWACAVAQADNYNGEIY